MNSAVTVQTGTVVKSTAGHDAGRFFAVVADDGKYVCLCDGDERKLASPKRKNKRHVAFTVQVLPDTAMKTDSQLRKALKEFAAKGGA